MPDQTSNADPKDAPQTLEDRVKDVLEMIRPVIQSDGGDIEFVQITDDSVVQVRLHGACVGCPSAGMTLKMGVERHLRERIPEITAVEAVG